MTKKIDLTKEEELTIFRKVCGNKREVTNEHTNIKLGNNPSDGYFNQGVSKVKLKEYIENKKVDFEYWKKLNK